MKKIPNIYDNLINKYSHLFTKNDNEPIKQFGFECGDGWYDLLEDLINHIDKYFKYKYKGVPDGFAITQIKEKFGGLRFYIDNGDDVVCELISFTETLSYKTCEFCGSNQNIMHSTGWIVTACESCIQNSERLKSRQWNKLTKI